MTTWTNETKSDAPLTAYTLLIDGTYELLIDSTYNLEIQSNASTTTWSAESKS